MEQQVPLALPDLLHSGDLLQAGVVLLVPWFAPSSRTFDAAMFLTGDHVPVAFHGLRIPRVVVRVLHVLGDHLGVLGEVGLAHHPHGGDHDIPLEDDNKQDDRECRQVGHMWDVLTILTGLVYLQHDVHHQEHLEEVLHVDALPVVDVAEAAGCEAVCVAKERQQEHGPDGKVDMVPVGSFHEPNDVAHQRIGSV